MAVMAPFLPYIMAAGITVAAVGAIRQGQAAAGAARFNSQLSQQNAQVADSQKVAALDSQSRDAQRRMGSAVAGYGASGASLSEGSPTDVLAESARMAALDRLTVDYNYKLRSMGYLNQAALDSSNAENASTAGYISAAGSLLGGSAKAISYYGR